MNAGGRIVRDILMLVDLFYEHCADRQTLDALRSMARKQKPWADGHGLFDHIRSKTLKASRTGNTLLETQYLFEEVCAKSLYNLTHPPAPFDADSPYWIIPNAFALARALGLSDARLIEIVAPVTPPAN